MNAFDLTLTGQVLPGHGREAATKALAALLRLDEARAEGLLRGQETVVKRSLGGDQLPRYLEALERAGVAVRADPVAAAQPASPAKASAAPEPHGKPPAANPFRTPAARVDDVFHGENNSGGGSGTMPPPGVKGWSWGAFLLNWIWAVFNKTWIGLLCLLPYVGFLMSIYLGIKGRELAWRNKRWDSVEHFNRVQRRWSIWGLVLVVGVAGIGILAAIAIPAYVDYTRAAGGR